MNRKTTTTPPARAFLHAAAPCAEPAMTRLREGYVKDLLKPTEAAAFKAHLLGCLACAASVTNMRRMAAATTGTAPEDAALIESLTSVPLIEPPCPKWRETIARLMTFRK